MYENILFDDYRINNGSEKLMYDVAFLSGIGKRESQQDSAYVLVTDNDVMAVLCDGMGGILGGQLASSTAIEAFIEYYQYYSKENMYSEEGCLKKVIEAVDDTVFHIKDKDGQRIGCGTTLVSVIICGDELRWVSVGDSRIYIGRENEFVQVTKDHNYFMELNELFALGKISEEKYKKESMTGEALISYIGIGKVALIDLSDKAFRLEKNDTLILCSDGIYRTIGDDVLHEIITKNQSSTMIADDIERQIKKYNFAMQDNYTGIIIKKRS